MRIIPPDVFPPVLDLVDVFRSDGMSAMFADAFDLPGFDSFRYGLIYFIIKYPEITGMHIKFDRDMHDIMHLLSHEVPMAIGASYRHTTVYFAVNPIAKRVHIIFGGTGVFHLFRNLKNRVHSQCKPLKGLTDVLGF
jgi:hypothetical protein